MLRESERAQRFMQYDRPAGEIVDHAMQIPRRFRFQTIPCDMYDVKLNTHTHKNEVVQGDFRDRESTTISVY